MSVNNTTPARALFGVGGEYGSSLAWPMAIQKDVHNLCNFCANLKLSAKDFRGSRDATSGERPSSFQRVILPSVGHIRSFGCDFCNFIVSELFKTSDDPQVWNESSLRDHDKLRIILEWIKDGRRLQGSDPISPSSRRLRITANVGALPDAYLVMMTPSGSDEQFLGRTIDSSKIDIFQLQRWLATCHQGHQGCCDVPHDPARARLLSNPSFRLIDVENKCIVPAKAQPFFALSYVWGATGPKYFATSDNIQELMQLGNLAQQSSRIPRTVQDAMHLTSLMGYRYLWVDSLCILQHDREDMERIITTMDSIYALATLTICAADGDANYGIPGLTQDSRNLRQAIIRYSEDVELMITRPAEYFVERSRWNTRAWTFQERICSRRSLIFVDNRVFYQCRQSVMCEDITMEKDDMFEEWSLETKDALGRLFLENPVRQYTKYVQLYTQRHLTFSGDKLVAFSAIETLLSQSVNTDFQMGLPVSYFDFALLWTISQTSRASPKRISGFPSWTWAGWTCGQECMHSSIEGVLANMHEWLCTRTWIDWYVVGVSGEATLVWDGKKSGVQGRWKGYASPNGSSSYGRVSHSGLGDSDQIFDPLPAQAGRLPSSDAQNCFLERSSSVKLRFYTHSAFFTVDSMSPNILSQNVSFDAPQWYSIFDVDGDWCGTVLLDQAWVDDGEIAVCEHSDKNHSITELQFYRTGTGRKKYKFIAISEAQEFSTAEHDSWTYYVPTDRVDSQWDLYYVLLIVTDDNGISERRGMGKVFKDAFKRSHQPGHSWCEILLG